MNTPVEKKFGTVKFFAEGKGYGFIIPDDKGPDIFFHVKNVVNGKTNPLQKDDHVSFTMTEGRRGGEAANVTVV